jgi:hypothetical protein
VKDESAEYNAPVVRGAQWLTAHPGGTIGPPEPDQLRQEAVVDGLVIATAYDDLSKLMDLVDKAEAEGRCPLHPADPN